MLFRSDDYRAAKDLVDNGDALNIEDAFIKLRDPKQFKKVDRKSVV